MRDVGKRHLCHLRTAKVQMSVRIRATWSEHSLFIDIYNNIYWFCKRAAKALISLRKCAGWSGPALPANNIRALFVHCASYIITTHSTCPIISSQFYYLLIRPISAVRVGNSVYANPTPLFVTLALGLHCLLRSTPVSEYQGQIWLMNKLRCANHVVKSPICNLNWHHVIDFNAKHNAESQESK